MAWYDEYLSHDVWPGTAPEPEAPRDRVAEILRRGYATWQQGECPTHGHQCSASLKCPICYTDLAFQGTI